jgi:dTDP-4-amino-4,6-dideoxygalactose transaminase
VATAGDAALFGLNISKMMTSIFGGMLTTNDPELARRLHQWRDTNFTHASIWKSLHRTLYLLAIYPAFNETLYGFVYWLQEETALLNQFTKAYHLDEQVRLPPDFRDFMLPVEAGVGLVQLQKFDRILHARRENARFYTEHLQGITGLDLPPLVEGATYSHYVVRVKDRLGMMKALSRKGIQLGQLIEYSVPHMPAYRSYANESGFANSLVCSCNTINLPIHASLSQQERQYITQQIIDKVRI